MVLFSCSYLGPLSSWVSHLVVAFYPVLFCYVLFAVRVRSALGAHTFCHFGTAFRLLHVLRFCFGSRLFKVLLPRSGTVLAPGASFERRVLLTVRDRFWLQEPALKQKKKVLLLVRDSFGSGSQA